MLHRFLTKLFGLRRPRTARRRARPRQLPALPSLELLEGRTLPAVQLAIVPITWNVIGLDSNNVNVGPNLFPVGARVTNTSATETATNVAATFTFDGANDPDGLSPFIHLAPGQPARLTVASLAPGQSTDFYFNVVVDRSAAAYDTTSTYFITGGADNAGAVRTPQPRELYVEHLVSQNRNTDLVITGPSTVEVGGTYTYHFTSTTAPGGYEEVTSYLTFPVDYQILAVATTYSTPTGATNDKVYADAGGFQNDPTLPDYREVVGPENYPGGKVGSVIQTDFTIKILSQPAGGAFSVTGVIYDKSGSSYHYNSDFATLSTSLTTVDRPPVTADDSATTAEDTPVVVDVLANDSDPNGNLDPSTVQVGTGPAHGRVDVDPMSGAVTYTPGPNFAGTDTFTYTVKDTAGNKSGAATVTVTVTPVNDPPVNSLPPDQLTPKNTALRFSPADGNAITIADPDAGTKPVKVTLSATNGTLSLGGTAGLTFLAGDGINDATVTFTGSLTAINAALDGLTFTPVANFVGTATLTVTTDDQGNSGAGGAKTDTDTLAIDVTGVNQPPVNIVPGTQTVLDGQTLTFSATNGNRLSVTDPDAGTAAIKVALSVPTDTGTLTVGPMVPGTVTVTGSGSNVLILEGPQADIRAALAGTVYAPAAGLSGSVILTVDSDDQGNSGTGGAKTDTDTVTIRVAPVNQPPVNTVPAAVSTSEDTPLVFSGANQLSVSDPDADTASVQVSLSVSFGTLTLGSTANLTFLAGDGTADTSIVLLGKIADLNAALTGLTYTPPANTSGTAKLTITTNDLGNTGSGGPKSDTDTTAITITPVNDPPVNLLPNTALTAGLEVMKTGKVKFSTADGNPIVVSDVDIIDPNTQQVEVALSVDDLKGRLKLGAVTGITIVSGADNTPALTIRGTLAAINNALDGFLYDPTNSDAGSTSTITIETSDLGNTGAPGPLTDTDTIAVKVVANNDANAAPVNIVPGAQTTNRNTPLVFSVAGGNAIYTTDVDALTDDLTVTLVVASSPAGSNGTLTLATTAGLTSVSGNGTNSVTLTGSLYEIERALDGLIYTPTTGFAGTVTLTMDTSDLGHNGQGGAKTDNGDTVTITVSGVNAAPTITAPSSETTREDTARVFSSGNGNRITLSDPDAGSSNVQVQLSVAHGTLTAVSTAGVTITGNGTGSVTLVGSVANINTALNGLSYLPSTDYNGADTLSVDVDDLGNSGTGGAKTASKTIPITVIPVDDAPTHTAPASLTLDEDTSQTFSISVADIDAGNGDLEVTLSAGVGTLTLGGIANLSFFTGDGTDDATLVFRGSLTDLNNALASVTWTPPLDFSGTTTISITTNDLGNTGADGPKSTMTPIAATVNPINDAPVNSVPGDQSADEDTAFVFSAANNNRITVADVDAGSSPLTVTLTVQHGILTPGAVVPGTVTVTGSSTGTLTLTGPQADINTALNGLTYTPVAGYTGADTLEVRTNDNGNTGSGGALTDTDSVGLFLFPVNDPPTITVPGPQTSSEDVPATFFLGVGDVDAGGATLQVTLTAANGVVTLGGLNNLTFLIGDGIADGTVTFEGTLADLNNALANLTFTPAANFNGTTTLDVTINDLGNTGLGGPKTASATVQLTFTAVNDPPIVSLPGAQATAEGSVLVFSAANHNAITVTDVDAGSQNITVTLTIPGSAGILNTGPLVPAGVTVAGNGTNALTLTGSQADINTALDGLKYTPAVGFLETFDLTVTADDLGHGPAGPDLQDTESTSVSVDPVDDAPVNSLPASLTFAEDTPLTITTLSISDPDAENAPVRMTVAAAEGTLTFLSSAGLTFFNGSDGTDDATLTFEGTIADINAALAAGLRLTPPRDFNGSSFLLVATNDLGNTGSGGPKLDVDFLNLTITEVNDAPVRTGADSLTVAEDSGQTALGLDYGPGGGTDENGQTLTILVTGLPPTALGTLYLADGVTPVALGGTYTLDQVRGLIFETTPDASGSATFTFVVKDDGTTNGAADPQSLAQSVVLTVTPVNDAPVANDDTATTPLNTSKNLDVLHNDDDSHGGAPDENNLPLTPQVVAGPGHGTATVNQDGTIHYTPDDGYTGPDSFTYQVTDSLGGVSNVATVSITVGVANSAPAANDDPFLVQQDHRASLDVLANDSDPDGDPLTITAAGDPAHGTTSIDTRGTADPGDDLIIYTPAAGFFGTDTFTYTIADGNGGTSMATVTLTVNAPPEAGNDTYSVSEDGTLNGDSVLGNDDDGHGGAPGENNLPLTAQLVAAPGHGVLVLKSNGTFIYTPDANFTGTDTFTYRAVDSRDSVSAIATVSILVSPVNQAPVANPDTATIAADAAAPTTGDVLDNDTDVDGGPLVVVAVDETAGSVGADVVGAHGTLTLAADGSFGYMVDNTDPAVQALTAGESLTDVFHYTLSDGHGGTATAALTITITGVDDVPTARPDTAATDEDAAITTGNVLANDSLGDGPATISAFDATSVHGGRVVSNGDGTFTYTPPADFNGTDQFTYTIRDVDGETSTATVTVTVHSVNDLPVATEDALIVPEGGSSTIDVLANDTGLGDGPLTLTVASPAAGTATVNLDGTITYVPRRDFHGADRFTYTITDADGERSTATVTVTVTPSGETMPPKPHAGTMTAGTSLTLDILPSDTAVSLTTSAVQTAPVGGSEVVDAAPFLLPAAPTGTGGALLPGFPVAGQESGVLVLPGPQVQGSQAGTLSAIPPGGANDRAIELAGASLSGFVYHDANGNGRMDPDETGFGGVAVFLTGMNDRGQPVQRSTMTDEQGFYFFSDLPPGRYTVTERRGPGWLPGTDEVGQVDGTVTGDRGDKGLLERIALTGRSRGTGYNFGEMLPASIAGVVYQEAREEEAGEGERGLAGVPVILSGTDNLGRAVSRRTTTDTEGAYRFDDLRPGNYTVSVSEMPGREDRDPRPGSAGGRAAGRRRITDIRLGSGTAGVRYNFGKYRRANLSGNRGGAPEEGMAAWRQLSDAYFTDQGYSTTADPASGQGAWGLEILAASLLGLALPLAGRREKRKRLPALRS